MQYAVNSLGRKIRIRRNVQTTVKKMIATTTLLFLLINLSRIKADVPILQSYPKMEQMAEVRAKYLYDHKQWSHLGWRDSFLSLDCSYVGENLAKNFDNTNQEHKALMDSPTHRENILRQRFTTGSIAIYKNITVELFCEKN